MTRERVQPVPRAAAALAIAAGVAVPLAMALPWIGAKGPPIPVQTPLIATLATSDDPPFQSYSLWQIDGAYDIFLALFALGAVGLGLLVRHRSAGTRVLGALCLCLGTVVALGSSAGELLAYSGGDGAFTRVRVAGPVVSLVAAALAVGAAGMIARAAPPAATGRSVMAGRALLLLAALAGPLFALIRVYGVDGYEYTRVADIALLVACVGLGACALALGRRPSLGLPTLALAGVVIGSVPGQWLEEATFTRFDLPITTRAWLQLAVAVVALAGAALLTAGSASPRRR